MNSNNQMIQKGKISSVEGKADRNGDKTTARVLPSTADSMVTRPLTIPWYLRGEMGNLTPGTEVAYAMFEDGTGIIDTDNHFHEMLYRMSDSLVLHDTLLPLHRKIVKYRQVSVGNSIRAKESFEEHRAIYEAVAAHDPDRAEELLLRHIENARASIMSQEEN